jgi:hypothetical protein
MTGSADPSEGDDWFRFHPELVETDGLAEQFRLWLLDRALSAEYRVLRGQGLEDLVSQAGLCPGDVFVVRWEPGHGRSVGRLGELPEMRDPTVDWDEAV